MHLLDLTLQSPAENLALDEALLDCAEMAVTGDSASGEAHQTSFFVEVLRLWEPPEPFVVLGRGSHVEREVDLAACRRLDVPVLRRASGGGTVVVGPGCLLYAVVLSYDLRPELRPLDAAHRFVLGRIAWAVSSCAPQVVQAGTSDLVVGQPETSDRMNSPLGAPTGRKCSGNSLRSKRRHFLYHGTLMYDFDIGLIESCLPMPARQPDYRHGRSHTEFLMNLPVSATQLRAALARVWEATAPLAAWPQQRTELLALMRYACHEWTWSR